MLKHTVCSACILTEIGHDTGKEPFFLSECICRAQSGFVLPGGIWPGSKPGGKKGGGGPPGIMAGGGRPMGGWKEGFPAETTGTVGGT